VLSQCSRNTPARVIGTWDITPAIATQLESDLSKMSNQAPGISHINGYERQYVGLVLEGNRRVIYINAFPLDLPGDLEWRKEPIVVCDGGANFWGATYDPQTHQFSQFEFNGAI
jgi:hypothetical protein